MNTPQLTLRVDKKVFKESDDGNGYVFRISEAEDNGLSLGENGELIATHGHMGNIGDEGIANFPGNSIVGTPNQAIRILMMTSTVTRRTKKPDNISSTEGLCIYDIVSELLST